MTHLCYRYMGVFTLLKSQRVCLVQVGQEDGQRGWAERRGTHSAQCGTCVLDPGLFPGISYFPRPLRIQVFIEQETGKKSWPQPLVTYKHAGLHLDHFTGQF